MAYTSLADGASVAVSLTQGWVIKTTGAGLATFGPGPLNGQTRGLDGKATVGPFGYAVTVYLTGRLSLAYEASDPTDIGTLTTAQATAVQALVSGAGISAKSKALRGFHAALALRNSAPCNLLHYGDSITWGLLSGAFAARWTDVMRTRIRQRFPQTAAGGQGFLPVANTFNAYTPPDAPAVWTGGAGVGQNFGPSADGFVLSASGHKIVYTFTGTGCDIWYAKYGGGGTMYYKVDGGAPNNIDTNGAFDTAARVQTIRGLSVASHTVEVGWVSGTSYSNGVTAYNGDESTGVRQFVAAWPGTASAYWYLAGQNNHHINAVTAIDPHLVTIELGANDFASSAGRSSPAAFKANVKGLIAAVKAKVTGRVPSFVLLKVWPLTPSGTPLAAWADYCTAMDQIAAEDPDGAVYVHDWQARTFGTAGDTLGGLMPDTAHPGPALNAILAEQLLTDILPV